MVLFALVRVVMLAAVLMATAEAWQPNKSHAHKQLARRQVDHSNSTVDELSPSIAQLKRLIENHTRTNMLFTQMFNEVPFTTDRLHEAEINNYHDLLLALNKIITMGPQWSSKANALGLLAAPIVTIMGYPMETPAGYAAFLEDDVNQAMRNILLEWSTFLSGPESAEVLNSRDGWFSPEALGNLTETANAPYNTNYTFDEMYQTPNSSAPYKGFSSWDAFFTRRLQPGVRPVASPNDDNVIVSACEAQPYNFHTNVQYQDKFWIKSREYSVRDMLAHDALAANFVNATVYQAYLSATSYHRWHAPVSGTVVKAFVQEGYYFSEPLVENGTFMYGIDPTSIDRLNSQGYMSAMATRAIIFIQADNPAIGLMAFIAVGNYEISTVEIEIKEGQHVQKGQEIGTFHFGGSSFVLLFRADTKLEGFPSVAGVMHNVAMGAQLAVVKSPSSSSS